MFLLCIKKEKISKLIKMETVKAWIDQETACPTNSCPLSLTADDYNVTPVPASSGAPGIGGDYMGWNALARDPQACGYPVTTYAPGEQDLLAHQNVQVNRYPGETPLGPIIMQPNQNPPLEHYDQS